MRQYLVGERAIHDAAGVTGCVTQVNQTTLGQQNQVVIVGGIEVVFASTMQLVYLWLDLFPVPVCAGKGRVDFVVEVTNVADHSAFFQCLEHVGVTDVNVAGGGDQQINLAQQGAVDTAFATVVQTVDVGRGQLKAVHASLHGADRIDFGNLDDHAFLTQGLSGAFADVTVADYQRLLARQQVVGGALDGVVQAVTAAILVVVLALGDRVIDVDRRYFQGAFFQHIEQTVNTGGGLFGDAVDLVQHSGIFVMQDFGQVATVVQHHVGFPRLAILEDSLLDTPFIFGISLTLPGEYGHTGSSDGCSGLILGRENVAAGPAYFGAQCDQSLDQYGSLNSHVNAAKNLGVFQWLFVGILATHGHQRRHF